MAATPSGALIVSAFPTGNELVEMWRGNTLVAYPISTLQSPYPLSTARGVTPNGAVICQGATTGEELVELWAGNGGRVAYRLRNLLGTPASPTTAGLFTPSGVPIVDAALRGNELVEAWSGNSKVAFREIDTFGETLGAAMLGYWSARNALAISGSAFDVIASEGQDVSSMTVPSRPLSLINPSRLQFSNSTTARLIQGGALQLLSLTSNPVVNLPDASGSAVGKGFTCTGGTTAPDGTRWAMNFGLPVEGSPATPAPSLVHLSQNFTTPAIGEITFAAISGTLTNGAQGLAYDTVDNVLVFWAQNKFWFVDPVTSVLVRTLDFTAIAINGLGYDVASDSLVGFATGDNSTLTWINKQTGVTGRTIPIYGTAVDHICFAEGYAWYSDGNNGTQGGINQLDLVSGLLVGKWFTDATAPEGIYVVKNPDGTWSGILLSDEWYHGTGTNNCARFFQLTPVPGLYPGCGRRVLFAGVAQQLATVGTTNALWTVGQPVTSGAVGIGLFFPASSSTTLRLQVNNSLVNFTVPSTLTEFLYSVDMNYNTAQASLYINGVLIATSTIAGLSAVATYPSMQALWGAAREGASLTRGSNSRQANWMIAFNPNLRQRMEEAVALDAGRSDLLPA